MNIFTRNMNFVKFNNVEMEWVKFNGNLVYESWKTLTTQGIPPLTLNKCKNINMLGYKVYGNSFQQTYTGKNLWNSELQQGCRLFSNGVYYSSYSYYLVNKDPIPVVAGQTYTISAKDYTAYDAGFVLFNNGTFVSSAHTVEPYMTVTIPSGVNQLYYNFRKSGSPSITPESIEEIQLEVGGTATSYEPYVGGIKAPNPSYPQEIESVGLRTKQLFDKTNPAMMFEGRVESDGKLYSQTYGQTVIVPVKPNTKYTINVDVSGYTGQSPVGRNAFYTEYPTAQTTVGTVDSTTFYAIYPRTVTTPADAKYWAVWVNRSQNVMQQVLNTLMIEEGETASSYEKYIKIPVKVSGQNVVDMADTSYNFDEPVSMWAATLFTFSKVKEYFKPSTTYTISYDVECISVPEHTEGFDNRYGFFLYSGVSGYSSIIMYQYGYLSVGDKSSYILTFTTPANLYDNNSNYRFLGYSNHYKNGDVNIASTMKFSNIQIVEGSYTSETMPSYQHYVAPTTSSIYLDEPLRKIGSGTIQTLPVGYTQLDYLESSGTQYIDTGIILTNQDLVTVKFSNSLNESYSIFGANDGTYRCQFFYNARSRYIRNFVTVNEHMLISGQVEYGTADTYYLDLKNRKYKQGTGNWVDDTNAYQATPQLSAFLFAQNNDGEASGIGTMKIYEYSVSRNGKEIQHLIPAKNSSNVVGMYDIVTNTFLTNQGTGTFASKQSIYIDYIDFETQKVYRNVGYIDLGKPTYTYQSQYTRFRSDTISGLKIITGNWTYDLKSDIYGTTLARNFNIGAQGGSLFVWDNRYTDPTSLKTALTGHYLIYALNAQTETSITLPSILLNKGQNIVSVGTSLSPSNMWIKYKGKN